MKALNTTIIRTTCGRPFNLRKAAPLASNTSWPYGSHNFVIFKTINGFYIKGSNTGNRQEMLDSFELVSRNEALQHLHANAIAA